MLCCVTPNERMGTDRAAVKDAVMACKIAAHTADLAKGNPQARERDDALSRARFELRWLDQFALSLDPEAARSAYERIHSIGPVKNTHFYSLRVSRAVRHGSDAERFT
jgi:phosphomethylpyrimidine synthase